MFIKGKYAWVENAAEEPQLIAAMKAGSTMKVDAKSKRGNPTSYVFSLKGISAALEFHRHLQIGASAPYLSGCVRRRRPVADGSAAGA